MKKRGFSWTITSAVCAGIAASLCCLGPLLSLSLGLGSFAASAYFAKLRPLLLVLTFALLGAAWYLAYRRPKTTCGNGYCARPPAKAARIILWLGTVATAASAAYPWLAGAERARAAAVSAAVAAGEEKFSVSIPSMDCAACAKGIEATLRRAPGVRQAYVNYDTKKAELVFDPAVTTRAKLLILIDDTGFPADRASLKP